MHMCREFDVKYLIVQSKIVAVHDTNILDSSVAIRINVRKGRYVIAETKFGVTLSAQASSRDLAFEFPMQRKPDRRILQYGCVSRFSHFMARLSSSKKCLVLSKTS